MRSLTAFFTHRFVLLALRWLLAGIFLYAGGTKLLTPQAFADSIATFRILPESLINLTALTLPAFEVLAGLAVIFNLQRRPPSSASLCSPAFSLSPSAVPSCSASPLIAAVSAVASHRKRRRG